MAQSIRIITALAICAAALPAASAAQSDTTELGVAVHQIVVELLTSGGTRRDQSFFAADSASAALLSVAGVSAVAGPAPASLLCPGSTTADAQPVPPPVGYVVRVVMTAGADSTVRRMDVSMRCFYRYLGRGRGFGEGGTWHLRLRSGRWYVGRMVEGWIT